MKRDSFSDMVGEVIGWCCVCAASALIGNFIYMWSVT